MEPLDVEAATQSDVARLVQLRDSIAGWLQDRGIRQWEVGEFGADRMRAWVDQDHVYVHRRAGRIVGAVAVLWSDEQLWGTGGGDIAGYVHLLMVDRDHAGEQIGRGLLRFAEARIAAAGRDHVRLDVVTSNRRLRRWYASQGYAEVRQHVFADEEPFYDTTLMEKHIGFSASR